MFILHTFISIYHYQVLNVTWPKRTLPRSYNIPIPCSHKQCYTIQID